MKTKLIAASLVALFSMGIVSSADATPRDRGYGREGHRREYREHRGGRHEGGYGGHYGHGGGGNYGRGGGHRCYR